jgi:hypothetical protein
MYWSRRIRQLIHDFFRVPWPNIKSVASVVPPVFPWNPKIQHCTRHSHTIGRSEFFESSMSLKYFSALMDIVLMITDDN